MSHVPKIAELLRDLERRHRAGQIDGMIVIHVGPEPGASWAFGTDVEREGDLIRLSGGVATVQHIITMSNVVTAQSQTPLGPRGTDDADR